MERNSVRAVDAYAVYRPMLDLMGKSEGTDKGRGYNEALGYGAYTCGDVDLISMTLDQIEALQSKMLANRKNKLKSSAVGRYQIIRTTLPRCGSNSGSLDARSSTRTCRIVWPAICSASGPSTSGSPAGFRSIP
ncbi:MAG: hypothetical protein IKE42_31125 [Aquamicrobium sp.]|jgi:hypothetical protein|uniref:hypothetical protein n=1 Tax=Mesorhizobium sp. Pch-S TaxID=2082387 RepID=UPI001A9253AE|nr:hypothetical protein [Mesorhizobium sp. Pch-S]MBR2692332.1 hypothetical protein [Aquamicrobium sp.]